MAKLTRPAITLGVLSICTLSLSNCTDIQDRALVYGERSGVNIALRSDPAKALPVEVNAGVQRRVTTLVPPKARNNNGRPTDEAVSLVSTFDLTYNNADAENGLFGGTTRIASIFSSGTAATALATAIENGNGSGEGLAEAAEANRLFVNKSLNN
ncbi:MULTISPECIES: hypothetical protein [unclassified Ruegeria]|uniref:hypothetical protein n=1 Tax=unclassified Ruegeria TaxID=2625375 RepID=UPI0014887F1C|nr:MULTISPECIES: hypothetical protein [unclassified Ruegeria]NOD77378.1 hypothetical protein [Ruegeria sp. HKCCD4332]NOD87801.1 hypothetical protein [Ruegeria sp. HKCCD4318]NOE14171.1 hypothetical protein [Ruegeria sp. HKCCD4318-2]NOG08472.1 hypothetical protein [Ruegeria sp. HKCCD4315]